MNWDKVHDTLRGLGRFAYVPHGGNRGDQLIGRAEAQELVGYEYDIMEYENLRTTKLLIVHGGGGGWAHLYGRNLERLRRVRAASWRVVMLPCTAWGPNAVALAKMDVVFCRERVSHNAVPGSILAPCAVMTFDFNPWASRKPSRDLLKSYRGNRECHQMTRAGLNDISSRTVTGSVDEYLDEIADHRRVWTDRVHLAMSAALMGRRVTLYQNSYFKNWAMYDYCLRDMRNVTWLGTG